MDDVKMFADMLFGRKDSDPIEAYIKSEKVQRDITISASLTAIIQILVEKGIILEAEFLSYQEYFKRDLEAGIRKDLREIQKD